MKNYKLTFKFDGYRFYDVVSANTSEEAKKWFEHHEEGAVVFDVEETTEEPSFTAQPIPPVWKELGFSSPEKLEEFRKYSREAHDKLEKEYLNSGVDVFDSTIDWNKGILNIEEWRAKYDN